jgi:Lon protease-like protein
VIASPIPIEAPVITTTLPEHFFSAEPEEAMRVCTLLAGVKSRRGVQSRAVSPLLPLFPLDLVLLPGVPVPLHIFEPRYKEMIKECLDQKAPFGVVRSKEEGFANIGCTAEIINVLKSYPDGRMNILAEGQKRFEILQVNQERSFLQAEVFYLDDEEDPPPQNEIEKAIQLHGEIMELAGARAEEFEKSEISQLAYRLAGSLPFDPDFQQALLEMNAEADRIKAIIAFFEKILPVLHRNANAKRKAGGNGHVN